MGKLVGGLLGVNPKKSTASIRNYTPTGFTSAGLTGSYTPGGSYSLTPTSASTSALSGLTSAYSNQAAELGGIRDQVAPGFGALTDAGVTTIRNRRREAIGNLRDNLSRRRVLGSSFASDALSRADAEFSEQEARFRADARMQELNMTTNLINQQSQATAQQFAAQLTQLNIESNLAAQIATGISQIQAGLAQAEAGIRNDAQTSGASAALDIGGTALGMLSFGILSSKELKDSKAPVDASEILASLMNLPVEKWKYIEGGSDHIGPYAEDFKELFGYGDGTTIPIVDAIGVLMASVKALAEKVSKHG